MSHALYLRRNTAIWDRALRFAIAAALALAGPALVRGPYWIALLGVVAGAQLMAGLTGY